MSDLIAFVKESNRIEADDKPIACKDCRFCSGTFDCYHDKALSYDVEGAERWAWRSDMRGAHGAWSIFRRLSHWPDQMPFLRHLLFSDALF